MLGRWQANLTRSGFIYVDPVRDPTEKVSNGVENVFSPATQASCFTWG